MIVPHAAKPENIARNVRIPLRLPQESTPVALLHIASLRVEYALHGFFRIGLIPELVVEGVTLEVRNAGQLQPLLNWLQVQAADRVRDAPVQIRNVCIRGDYEGRRILAAGRLMDLRGSQWVFQNGTCSVDGRQFIHFESAALTVHGPEFGRLTLHSRTAVPRIQFLLPDDNDSNPAHDPDKPCGP